MDDEAPRPDESIEVGETLSLDLEESSSMSDTNNDVRAKLCGYIC